MANFHGWNRHPQNRDGNTPAINQSSTVTIPAASGHATAMLQRVQNQDPFEIYKIALEKRVIIIEGISGSGKDSFQTYLKQKLGDRVVYDFSEGEVLHSWKQLQIEGISRLRVRFMKLLVRYIRDTLSQDSSVVFLLNRFHLSTYFSTIARQPRLAREYDQVIAGLRELPIHIFILLLDEKEIEVRSRHPERSGAWRRHEREIVNKEGFSDTQRRHVWQQELILKAAIEQGLPYSLVKSETNPGILAHWVPVNYANENDRTIARAPIAVDSVGINKRRATQRQKVKAVV